MTPSTPRGTKVRVAHLGTGATGREALKGILNHPDLELVSLWVTSPDKVGKDAGELVGRSPAGIIAVGSLDEALACEPGVLSYLGNGLGREAEAVAEMAVALGRGVNVATTSLLNMLYPPAAPVRTRWRTAGCRDCGPGVLSQHWPRSGFLLRCSARRAAVDVGHR